MPGRNLALLLIATAACLAALAVESRSAPGRRFNEVLALIERAHLGPVDPDTLLDAAVNAVMNRLGDDTAYERGSRAPVDEPQPEAWFGGVGLELELDGPSRTPRVLAVLPDGPAGRAGIAAGSLITAIDGVPTTGVELPVVVQRLRGRSGEPVTLRVTEAVETFDPLAFDTAGRPQHEVVVVRETVQPETVLGGRRLPDGSWSWRLEDAPDIALVRISGFGPRTVAELDAALQRIAPPAEGPVDDPEIGECRGLVIDLRGTSGGSMTAVVEACDRFLDAGTIVVTRSREDRRGNEVRRASPGAALSSTPMVVLVDGLTAAAAEVFAAALQDHGRAVVAGSRSCGRGTVQSWLPLADGTGSVRLTTAEYLRSDGRRLNRRPGEGDEGPWGVQPDPGLEIAPTGESLERLRAWRRIRDLPRTARSNAVDGGPLDVDEVLAAAVRCLRSR
jgi:carboxyl-terminal processing protease